MKKLFIIVFLLIVFVGLIGNAAKIDNDYLDKSGVVSQPFSNDMVSPDSQESAWIDQRRLLTLGFLFGTGLVGLLVIRRK
ncbi:hypothetical protein N9C84_03075 [Desulfobacterales bacterium]|nr:hypothetical protein [Desulfobacterales bacterium]